MDTSTWAGVAVGVSLIVLSLAMFAVSLVPGLLTRIRVQLAALPDHARELGRDVRSWWHFHGRHVTTGAPVHDEIECYAGPCAEMEVDTDGSRSVIILPDGTTERPHGALDEPTEVQSTVPAEAEHEGATEDWSPHATLATALPEWAVAHTEPDDEERRILLAFESVVGVLRAVPDEYVEFAASVDAGLAAAGLNGMAHRRWRATAFDVPTGEYRLALASA